MRPSRILVKIAAYRDPELPKTIRSAIEQAAHPGRLRFAIVNQHDTRVDEISLAEWSGDARFRAMDVLHTQTLGLGWARSSCDAMWSGEEFTL